MSVLESARGRMLSIVCGAIFVLGLPGLTLAQGGAAAPRPPAPAPHNAAQQPSISMVLKSVDELYADLQYILGLANDAKAWGTLKDVLDLYVIGVDPKQPVVVELKVRNGEFKQILHVPVPPANVKAFLSNIKQLGVKTKPVVGAGVQNLFEVSGLTSGFLRLVNGHAIFAENRSDLLVPNPAPPAGPVAALIKQFDVGMAVENGPQGMQERLAAIQKVTKEARAALKPAKDETPEEFALRKATVEHQMAELERFYVESAQILLGWTTSVPEQAGRLNIQLTPLPETSLAKSAELVGGAPSYFAGYRVDEKLPFSGVMNFGLDELRQKNLLATLKLSRPAAKQQIEKSKNLTEPQRVHALQVSDLLHDVIEHAATSGVFDGFLDVRPTPDHLYSLVGGVKTDGAIVARGLQGFQSGVKMGVEREGEIEIHAVELPANRPELHELFGKSATIFVGTAPQAVWFSVGPDALPRLKEAAAKLTQPAAEAGPNPAVAFHAQLAPWVDALVRHRGPTKLKKGEIDLGKLAVEAFKQGADTISFRLERVNQGNVVQVHMQTNAGVLRLVGKVMAEFIHQTLE